ncbi:hypothetical protein [Gemmata sp.]|uniref:hypothetical protein n=1 Tax=Gemmata sp. TaxID=1914242 RepID=UPI003F70E6EC
MIVAIPIGLLIGAVILRGAVSLANMCVGGGQAPAADPYEDEYEGDHRRPRYGRYKVDTGIPVPSIGQAMVVVLLAGIANFVIQLVIVVAVVGVAGGGAGANQRGGFGANPQAGFGARGAGAGGAEMVANLISLPATFLVASLITSGMLPTSFGRACLVTLFQYLIVIAIAIAIGIAVVAVVGGVAGFNGFKA